MRRALRLAANGMGTTHPNPMVGAVLVKNGHVVGEGWHRKRGETHAEVLAIRAAGSKTKGSTLFINLEPCCHHGLTSPCTEAIIESGIARVIAAVGDPNPKVSGKGFAKLQEAGIEVSVGLLESSALELNRAYLHFAVAKTPYVTLKLASSLDGRIATAKGESRWITGEASRKAVHVLRSNADAVLIGVGTVLADDPQLSARGVKAKNQPRRVILDPSLKTPPGALVIRNGGEGRPFLVVGRGLPRKQLKKYEETGVKFWRLPVRKGMFSWPDLARELVKEGIIHLMVEGGAQTAAWFVKEMAVRRLELFIGPIVIGGNGIPSVGKLDLGMLNRAPRFTRVRCESMGEDLHMTADAV